MSTEVLHENFGIAAGTELFYALLTNLAHALTRESHLSAYLLKTFLLSLYAEALLNYLDLTWLQDFFHDRVEVGGHRLMVDLTVRAAVITGR